MEFCVAVMDCCMVEFLNCSLVMVSWFCCNSSCKFWSVSSCSAILKSVGYRLVCWSFRLFTCPFLRLIMSFIMSASDMFSRSVISCCSLSICTCKSCCGPVSGVCCSWTLCWVFGVGAGGVGGWVPVWSIPAGVMVCIGGIAVCGVCCCCCCSAGFEGGGMVNCRDNCAGVAEGWAADQLFASYTLACRRIQSIFSSVEVNVCWIAS